VPNNLPLESAGLTPDGSALFTVTENALLQDGPASTLDQSSPGRIIEVDLERRLPTAEYLYWVDPVAEPPANGSFTTAGAVEILALSRTSLLVLERSFSLGAGNTIRLYEVDLSRATNILDIASLEEHGFDDIEAATKRLLIHINGIGVEPDNIEGMTFGPRLADGSPTLVLVADDNFNPLQTNQVLAFALREQLLRISEIQGAAHRSPYEGDWVRGVEGVVTAVDPHARYGGFWLAGDGDGDSRTSDALFVFDPDPKVERGDRISVDGGVREIGSAGSLTTTRLDRGVVDILDSDVSLPAPVEIGVAGRLVPDEAIDDDAMRLFEPCCDTIDFFESLEGMRISVDDAVATSGTSRYGEIVVVPDGGEQISLRSARGGAVLQPGDSNPERIVVDDRLADNPPSVAVGDLFRQPLIGVLDYSFGNYKMLVEEWPTTLREQRFSPAAEPPAAPPEVLTVASYNVLNLDALDGSEQFRRLAQSIVDDLDGPDLIGLQEIQDDNGTRDGGVVGAAETMKRLIGAIEQAGGRQYDYRQIDPEHNADGGQPNGNIRVVWMFDPERVRWIDRRTSNANDGVTVLRAADGGVELSASPGRLQPTEPAFAGDQKRGWEGGRKCLAGEVEFAGHALFLLNCHLKSKSGDKSLFGASQPPNRRSEEQRLAQAAAVSTFVQQIVDIEPDARVVVLGDMNEHEFREPIRRLAGDTLVNLADLAPASERYSYNYKGNSQVLDHILVSRALAERSPRIRYVHINADSAHDRRASDHDPILAWLRF
jgi:predicted extracellular nuclease